ncbi:MAG TPA: hypothetical protein VJR29_00465 [bacterium]|nr:hypothetical protein [bacterium]
MLTSMKILIEKQIENWQGGAASTAPRMKTSACGFGPASPQSALLNNLQNGGCILSAGRGDTLLDPEPVELPVFKLKSRLEVSQDSREDVARFFQEIGIEGRGGLSFPEQNPLTLEPIDWEKEICRSTLQNLSAGSARLAQAETLSQDAKLNRLVHLMMLAIRSGNISLAMMMFAHVESRMANQMTQILMTKVQEIQDRKRKLTQDIQSQKTDSAEGAKKLQILQNDVSQANDDIAVLQTFIRDVAQNKQSAVELANAFLSKEHETTMAVVRSFGR